MPRRRDPSRRARISAWAVGSWRSSRSLWAAARTSPSRHEHRADRHVLVFQRTLGLTKGHAHEVVVLWEHALAHRSRPPGLRQCLAACRPRHFIITEGRCHPAPKPRPRGRPPAGSPGCSTSAPSPCGIGAAAPAAGASLSNGFVPGRIVVGYAAPGSRTRPAGARASAAGSGRARSVLAWCPSPRERASRRPCDGCAAAREWPGRFRTMWRGRPARRCRTTRERPAWREAGSSCSGTSAGRSGWTHRRHGPTWPPTALPGGRGVTVAVLDTGVAYANRGPFRRSPDFEHLCSSSAGYDFVAHNPFPNDRNGHGTFVASTIAEATNNGLGLTGLAFGARIMPVRVLDTEGEGEASTIAEGVRFAVRHKAQVINLSLEFSPGVTASDIPELIEALRYAHRHGVLVVAAAGNEGHTAIAYPAHAPYVVSVGATTERGCLAAYSNDGTGLTLVAPGGGPDAALTGDPNCDPEHPGRDIFQVTFTGSSPRRFGIPTGYEGTSMATPHVSATAALVIASGVLGRHPSPAAAHRPPAGDGPQARRRRRRTPLRRRAGGRGGSHGSGRTRDRRRASLRVVSASPPHQPPPERCDLAVVGGGILGLAVARELIARHPRASVGRARARGRARAPIRRGTTRASSTPGSTTRPGRSRPASASTGRGRCTSTASARDRRRPLRQGDRRHRLLRARPARRARAAGDGQRGAGPAPDRRRRHRGDRAARPGHRRSSLARHRHRRLPRRRARLRRGHRDRGRERSQRAAR